MNIGDIYDVSYNNPYHFNRHSLGDQYKLNYQHNINNQNWFMGNSNNISHKNGEILRESARYVLPNSYNQNPNYNYSQRNFSDNNKSRMFKSVDSLRNENTINPNHISTLKYNLSVHTGEISKNPQSEYRTEYVPYSPEYYQPLFQKRIFNGKRLRSETGFIFKNEKNKKRSFKYGEYKLPEELIRKLQKIEGDSSGPDSEVEYPEYSETNAGDDAPKISPIKRLIQLQNPNGIKEKKVNIIEQKFEEPEEEEKNIHKLKGEFKQKSKKDNNVKPYFEDIEIDEPKLIEGKPILEFERENEDEKAEVLDKVIVNDAPTINEKPNDMKISKEINKPNEKEKPKVKEDSKNGKSNISLIPEDKIKDNIIEPPKDPKPVIKKPAVIKPTVINKDNNEEKPNDINVDKDPQNEKPKLMEKPVEIVSINNISKPNQNEKLILDDIIYQDNNETQPLKSDNLRSNIIEPKKDDKPIVDNKKSDDKKPDDKKPDDKKPDDNKPDVISPLIINKQIIDNALNDIPLDQIESSLKGLEPIEEIKSVDNKTTLKPSKSEKPKETSLISKEINKNPIKSDTEKTNITEPKKEPKIIKEDLDKPKDEPEKKPKKKFVPISVDYLDKDDDNLKHEGITSNQENTVGKTDPTQYPLDEYDDDEEEFSGIIPGINEGDNVEYEDNEENGLRKHFINTQVYEYEDPQIPQEVNYMENNQKDERVNEEGGVYIQKDKPFQEQVFDYDDGQLKGDDNKDAGVVKQKKKKFEEQVVDYNDGQLKGDDNKDAGVVKQKKKKFEEQVVDYNDGQLKGDDNKDAGAAKRNEFKEQEVGYEEKEYNTIDPNLPDFIISGIIPGIGVPDEEIKEAIKEEEKPMDFYMDEEEFRRKHQITSMIYEMENNNSQDAGIIKGKKNNFKEQEIGYEDNLMVQPKQETEKYKKKDNKFEEQEIGYEDNLMVQPKQKQEKYKKKDKKFEEQEIGYEDNLMVQPKYETEKYKKKDKKFEEQEIGYEDNLMVQPKQKQEKYKKKDKKFEEQEIGYEDNLMVQPKQKQEKYKKKDKKFEEQEIGYEDNLITQPKQETEKYKKKDKKFEEQEIGYEDNLMVQPKYETEEPKKIDENQPDYIISGIIPGKGHEEEMIDGIIEKEDQYPEEYYIDEDNNDNMHNIKVNLYGDNLEGIIPGLKNDYNIGHNYAGLEEESEEVSLSQIFVDYSKNKEVHNNFEDF